MLLSLPIYAGARIWVHRIVKLLLAPVFKKRVGWDFYLKLKQILLFGLIPLFFSGHIFGASPPPQASPAEDIRRLTGGNDAVIIASPQGQIIFELNPDKKLIPASTLKIFTALTAFHYLGLDHRFKTEFYLSLDNHLKIKGYGDPLLISELLPDIARDLNAYLDSYNDIVLDDTFFSIPIEIPGTSLTYKPYDAPNGALSVNFNTVNFKRLQGTYVSAEEQTPLLPFVVERVKASRLDSGRIILTRRNNESTLYAGHLFKHFLSRAGIESNGGIRIGRVQKEQDRLLLTYWSPFSMQDVVTRLLEYSNNFIANQVLLTIGAQTAAPPGTLDKGVCAALSYAEKHLGIHDLMLVEGSGISRKNKISARNMLKFLNEFQPYRHLMRQQDSEFYKTGNLSGITTRAGYWADPEGRLYPFAVLINTPGSSILPVMKQVQRIVETQWMRKETQP